ncbi:TetR/AcrR family transcriptional regulator [Paenibacillus sp. KQZ6P-2]|uniref:TetR/AcrR family transcriptional regulator n=1 Tax=Paenibacillus mangrovi TaxID=2931978 RepID=A0A9X2B224_9BACL|nr:TetR/AcrR family transcriptional regulator [Paenibacillus mangrovi]MCJ8012134.1 TetR/AcrR family transcriptional regulator [Paenibacillus mangrovi]
MPRKFNDQEKEQIRQKLLEVGQKSFETLGLKKTSIEDLTKAVGIAQGSFYMFYKSKEELCYEILLNEEASIRESMLQSISSNDAVTKESIRDFMLDGLRLMSENPLIRQMYLEGEFEYLIRKLPSELLEQNYRDDQDAMMPVAQKWQNSGILSDAPPELIVSMFRAIVLLSLHKKEIGEHSYTATIELLVDMLAEGMIAKSKRKDGSFG